MGNKQNTGPNKTSSSYSETSDDQSEQYSRPTGGFRYRDSRSDRNNSRQSKYGDMSQSYDFYSGNKGNRNDGKKMHTGEKPKTRQSRSRQSYRYASDASKNHSRNPFESSMDMSYEVDISRNSNNARREIRKQANVTRPQVNVGINPSNMGPPKAPVSKQSTGVGSDYTAFAGQNVIIRETRVYIRDSATQTVVEKDASTQTGLIMSFTTNDIKQLLHFIGLTTGVAEGKPSFSCKRLAEKLTTLTGISISPEWVLHSFK